MICALVVFLSVICTALSYQHTSGAPLNVGLTRTTTLQLGAIAKNLDTGKELEIMSGQPMSLAAVKTGLRLSFQCKAGTCGSCEFLLDGKVTRSCITKVPNKKSFTIKKKGK